MDKYDRKTLAKQEAEYEEKKELLARKRWLLLHHPDFMKELRDVEQAAGKRLPWGRVLPPEMILDYRRYLGQLDQHGTPRRAFMVKYKLIPNPDRIWELAELRQAARVCNWGKGNFRRDAWWYELSQKGKTAREIVEETLDSKSDWIDIDLSAFDYWATERPDQFKRLCRIAKVPKVPDRTDKLKLLYHLGRFKLVRAKGDFGFPAREYPPFDGGSRELQADRLYLIHVNYEWPEEGGINQLFAREPEQKVCQELKDLRSDWLELWKDYTDGVYIEPMYRKISKAIERMQKKIDKTYRFYQEGEIMA